MSDKPCHKVTPEELIKNRHDLDMSHIKITYITHFYCNQSSISSVIELLEKYADYPANILDAIAFIIVDDGSNVEYEIPDFNLNLTWLKINEDIQWNQAGARNLGVTYAKSDKIIITDLDHEFPVETFEYMINAHNPGRNFYKIYRTNQQSKQIEKGHSNLFFMSRARFMRHFGYDEEFSGHYGSEDYRFVKYHKYHGSKQRYLPKKYRCFERELDRKNSYHSLKRDLAYNTPIDRRKKQEVSTFGADQGHSRIFLNFTWKILSQKKRPPPIPQTKTLWKEAWWFRYVFSYWAR